MQAAARANERHYSNERRLEIREGANNDGEVVLAKKRKGPDFTIELDRDQSQGPLLEALARPRGRA